MVLYLLRHGIAVEAGGPGSLLDQDRPLTPRGIGRVERVARFLDRLNPELDLILSSPFLRARQTAEVVARTLKLESHLRWSTSLAIPGNSERLIAELNAVRPRPQRVLLVGHEPHLGELVGLLTTGRAVSGVTFRKAGLCQLEVKTLLAGRCATLEWMLPPRLLKKLT